MPFITDDPIVPTGRPFISNDPAVPMSPEETAKAWESGQLGDDALTPAQALQVTLQKAKSRQDPVALIRGALAGTGQLISQGWGAGKELASYGLKNPPSVAGFGLTKAAAEGALRGSADLGQIGKNVLEGAVLNPYEIVSKAAEKRGWPVALAQAAQVMQPSLEVGTPMEKLAKIFPLETADVARQSMISDRQTALQRQQLAENKRSLLEELTTAGMADPMGMLPFGDSIPDSVRFGASPATAEALGQVMAPPAGLGNLTETVGMVADPTMLAAPGASLAAKLGAKVAPRMAARLGAGQVAGQARQALLEGFEQAAQAAPPSRARFVGGPEGGIRDVGPVPPPVIQPRFVGGPDGTVSIKAPPVIPTTPELAPLLDAYTGAVRQAAGAPRGMGQAAVGRVGRVAEQIGGAVSRAAETVGDLADRYRTALGVISATAGAIKGPLGVLAGSQLPKAVSMAAKWAKETSRAGAALRTIAAADWKSSVPVWRQIAKDPNAPQWLVRGVTAPVVGRLTAGKLAEGAIRGGGRIAAGAAEGAATDALFAAADPEMGGEDIGAEAGPGGLIGFLSTSATARGAARQQKADAVAYDAMRIAARSIEAGANPLVVARASDRLMQTAAVMETLFRGSLTGQRGIKIDLMDAGQFAKVAGSSAEAAFFDPQTGRVAVNLETIDADGRQLHEVSHALMQSAASSNPAIVEHFRGLLGPDGLARARQEYQQALGREIPQDDAYIVGELFAESVANSLRGVDLSEGVPAAIGDTRTVSFFRDADVRKALRDASTQDLVRQQVDALTNFRPAVDLEREPGVKLDPAMAGKHPAFPVEQQANGTTGNDFVQQTPDGRTVATPPAQVRTRVRNRRREVLNLFPDTEPIPDAGPTAPTAPPAAEVATRRTPAGIVQKTGTRLGDRFYATAQSFGEATKNMLRRVEDAIANGETLSGWYQQIGQGDNWAASVRESLGAIEAQFKDFIPYAFKVDKQGNLLVENYSLTALERKANQWANRQGPLSLEMWNGDIAAFRQDVQTYLRNHSEGRPGADGLGDGKRNVINVFLVGGNRTFEALNPLRVQARGKDRQGIVRSYRADRLQTVEPSEVQGFQKPDYGKQVRNLSPKVGEDEMLARYERFTAAQQEFNSIPLGSTGVGHKFDRAFHLTKLVRRLLDGLSPTTYDRMIAGAQKRGAAKSVAQYESRRKAVLGAMGYVWNTLADLTASLPEHSATDLRTSTEADPFRVLKEHFPGGQKRPLPEILNELSEIVAATREQPSDKASAVRDVANMAEVIRDFADVDQSTMDALFNKVWGKTEAQKNAAEASLMAEMANPEFNDVTKQGTATVIRRLPENPDLQASPKVDPQTQTPEFKRWFGNSKVVDADGVPLRLYHGTSKDMDFSSFSGSARGIWFTTDPAEASRYAKTNDSRNYVYEGGRYKEVNTADRVMPVYLSIQNPMQVTGETLTKWKAATNYRAANRELVAEAKRAGHDGLQFSDSVYVAFEPTQIKSATGNRGTFDPTKKNIRFSPTVTKNRNTALQEAAQQVRDGKMTREEYQRLVQVEKPYQDMAEVPRPLSTEEVRSAIGSARADRAGKAREVLQEGQRVGARIDIRASEAGSYVTTLHEPRTSEVSGFAGKPITYEGGVRLRNVRFASNATGALDIAAGRAKGTIATIEGDYMPTPAEQVYRQAQRLVNDPEWAQLGMDPERQSQFYLRSTGEPVVGADEVLQVGRFVLARNVQKASPAETAARTQTRYTGPDGQPVRYSAKVEANRPGSGMSMPKPMPFSRRKALPVPSWERAEQMWDAGYSLYGAPYDGMEGGAPLPLRSRDEIEDFDPENLFAIPGPDAKPLPSDTRHSPRIEQSVLDLDKLGNKDLPQVNAKTIPYPANPTYPNSIALPARWGLVNEKIVGMPKTAKEVSDIVVRQVDRLERVIQDMPEFARESARFYLDMAESSMLMVDAAFPSAFGQEKWRGAELMLRFLALGSPRTGVSANATKSSYSTSAAASDFTAGLKIGFGSQQTGAKNTFAAWKKGLPFDMSGEGVDNKVRNFYMNGLAELIDLARNEGDSESIDYLMDAAAAGLDLIKPGEKVSAEQHPEVQRLLDGMATVDMWDMAAKGYAWPGWISNKSARPGEGKTPWVWTEEKHATKSTLKSPMWARIAKELSKKKRVVRSPADLRYQEARALRVDGNKDWDATTWAERIKQPFEPDTEITTFRDVSEEGLSPGGAGPLYDAQQTIDGLVADEINRRGLANLFGKDKLLARNAQEILWALERLDNPLEANNELALFGNTFKALASELNRLRTDEMGPVMGGRPKPIDRGATVLKAMESAYAKLASQDLPLEVVSVGTTPEARLIQSAVQRLRDTGVDQPELVVTRAVADNLQEFLTQAADSHGVDVTVDSVAVGDGGYTEEGAPAVNPNMVLRLRGNPDETRNLLEILSRALDQDGGNIFRRPTISEINTPTTKFNTVVTFATKGMTTDQKTAFFMDLNRLKDADGNSFFTGFTETADGMAIGDQFYGGDMGAQVESHRFELLRILRKHGVSDFWADSLIIETVSRKNPEPEGLREQPFAVDIMEEIKRRLETVTADSASTFPQNLDEKARALRRLEMGKTSDFSGKTALTRYFVEARSSIDAAMLRGIVDEARGEELKEALTQVEKLREPEVQAKAAEKAQDRAKVKALELRRKASKERRKAAN